jgi:DNA helicase-2/ATP-dependent DNA helicase PcrA
MKPQEAVDRVMEYYVPILKEKFDDYPRRQKELEQLLPMAGRYKKLKGFLDDLILDPPTSSADVDLEKKGEALTLSTVHSAKGLEWPVVFIIWVMEGRFPSAKAYSNPLDLEEERRLMYVAATRAKDQLIMCYPGQESIPAWQLTETAHGNGLSSFIRNLPSYVISHESPGLQKSFFNLKQSKPGPDHYRPEQEEPSGLSRGDRVSHPAFGPGVISKLVGQEKVEVLFKNAGRKLLHLEYTTLEKI